MKNEIAKAKNRAAARMKYIAQHPNANTISEPTELRTCLYCGREFIAIRPRGGQTTQFCSVECRRKRYRQKAYGLYTPFFCTVCGRESERTGPRQKYCIECKQNIDTQKNKIKNQKRTEIYIKQHQLERPKMLAEKTAELKELLPEEISLISIEDSTAKLQCNICGAFFEKSLFHLPHKVECANCKTILKESLRKEVEDAKNKKKMFSDYWKNFQENRVCKHCGNNFVANRPDKYYCSAKCNRAASRKRRADKNGSVHGKIKKRFAPDKIIDTDITVKTLYERDNGICHICGKPCDINDFVVKNGTTICGDNYPSIDHVIPCAKGGEHSWANVKLAHRRCNYLKSDKVGTKWKI